MTERLAIVGASLAGLRAAEAARRNGFTGRITLVGAEPHLPYDRPPLSKKYLLGETPVDHYRTDAEIRNDLGVDLHLGITATGLDPAAHLLLTTMGLVDYDRLVIATGAAPRTLPSLPPLDGILTLRTLDDAVALRDRIRPGSHVVVLGAGFIGSEIASSAKKLGAHATIVEAAPVPLVRAVGEVVGSAIAGLHERNGTRLLLETSIEEYVGSGRVEAVRLSTGEVLPADLVVIGIGAAPATQWLRDSGIRLHDADGSVVCDAHLRSSSPDVYAAGDVAHWPNDALGLTMRLENWTNAAEQAARAGANAADPANSRPYATVPYFWSDWYGSRIQFVGTAIADGVEFVAGDPDESRFVAVYRSGDRIVGAATLDEPRIIMKLRRLIAEHGDVGAAADTIDTARAAVTRRG
jgi:NADPH-dependent 2,4-dienoyl-CoA reductase/sulfur reductase-like enzyme